MEPEQHLAATLFTAAGKLAATIGRFDHLCADIAIRDGWTGGSVAILTRNGLRLFGTLQSGENGPCFLFDDPLDDWQRDVFAGRASARRPIVIRERLAA